MSNKNVENYDINSLDGLEGAEAMSVFRYDP